MDFQSSDLSNLTSLRAYRHTTQSSSRIDPQEFKKIPPLKQRQITLRLGRSHFTRSVSSLRKSFTPPPRRAQGLEGLDYLVALLQRVKL